MAKMYSYEDVFGDANRSLFVMAHPDDADVFFGGTIARLIEDKKEVFVLVVTNGCRGSRENEISEEKLAITRIEEQRQSLMVYGVPGNHFSTLNYKDGEADNNMELIGKIAYTIRKFKPDIVCTHNPNGYFSQFSKEANYFINHRDHRICGISTVDAVYPFSRDKNFFIEHTSEGLQPHTVHKILFTGTLEQTNVVVDIKEDIMLKKKNGLAKHKSQFDSQSIEEIIKYFSSGKMFFEKGFYINL